MEIIKWLVTSSSDPQKYSLMLKGALSMGVAYVIQLTAITCGFHLLCVQPDVLTSAVDTIANIAYLGLSLIGAVQFLWGPGRKIWLNRISAYQIAPAELPH
jgi:hypothetical protein